MEQDRLEEKKRNLIRFLKGRETFAVAAAGGDRVSVTMNSRFQVTKVSLREGSLPRSEAAVLEEHIAQAVNTAFSEMAAKLAERLASAGAGEESSSSEN
jgi:DNA-binding protein YbaB